MLCRALRLKCEGLSRDTGEPRERFDPLERIDNRLLRDFPLCFKAAAGTGSAECCGLLSFLLVNVVLGGACEAGLSAGPAVLTAAGGDSAMMRTAFSMGDSSCSRITSSLIKSFSGEFARLWRS